MSLRARGVQWSPSGDYIVLVDYGSRSCAQIAVLRLEGSAAAPALSEAARLDALPDRRSALSHRSVNTLLAFSVAERYDELLIAYSRISSTWPDNLYSASTCALWTLPIEQLQPRRQSALDTLSRLCGSQRLGVGRLQSLSQHIDNALSRLAHMSLERLDYLSLSLDGRHLAAFVNLSVVLLIDLSLLGHAPVEDAAKIVRNDNGVPHWALFGRSPDGALFAMASNWQTEDLLGGSLRVLLRHQLMQLSPTALQEPDGLNLGSPAAIPTCASRAYASRTGTRCTRCV